MQKLSTHMICDLRIERHLRNHDDSIDPGGEWYILIDEGAEDNILGVSPVIAQGTREEVATRVVQELRDLASRYDHGLSRYTQEGGA